MNKIPSHYPEYFTPLVQSFIDSKKYTIDEINHMIQEYNELRNRIVNIKIQGDQENQWWDPNDQQTQAINCFIFEILGPYFTRCHLTFYTEETHGPYDISGKNYQVFIGHNFPNFILKLQDIGRRREVNISILPQHNGATF